MNNYFPYDKDQWNQIVENAFSPDAPDPPFSEAYQTKKRNMEESLMKKRVPMKKSAVMMIAIAAALAVLTPTTAFAASQIHHARLEQTAEYQKTVKIDAGDSVSDQIMDLSIGWVPDGLVYHEEGAYAGKYHDDANPDHAMTPCFMKMEDTSMPFTMAINYAVEQEEYTTKSGNTVLLVQRDAGYDEVWVAFTGTPYVAQMYVKGFSAEEKKKLAENLTLVPSDVETAEIWNSEPEEEMITDHNDETSAEYYTFAPENLTLCHVGDTVYDTVNGRNFSVHIDSAVLQDNFDGLTTDCIGLDTDYSKYLDKDGKITSERTWIRSGDGIDTLHEVVKQDIVTQKVLVLNLTCTNEGESGDGICFCPKLFQIQHENLVVGFTYDLENDLSIAYAQTGELMPDDGHFSFQTANNHEKNGIYDMEKGETVQVQLAFLVNEDSLDNLYLDLLYQGSWPKDDINAGMPILDLCDLAQ